MNYGGPYNMVIKGKNLRTIEGILIGEVWVCSGQSNMEWPVSKVSNAEAEIAAADYPEIRLFTVNKRIAQFPEENLEEGEWWQCSPVSVPNFSAVGYFFGRELYKKLKVPIGLINTSWGGTVAETWSSKETISKDPDFAAQLETLKKMDMEKNTAKIGPNQFPTLLFNGMINPIIPYGIRGAIWYQGESNADRAQQYKRVFPDMIKDWRNHWGQGAIPFLFVQLANYTKPVDVPSESNWAELREAQTQTLDLENTGMAVIIDAGEANDIHPRDKQTVGYRLALSARKVAYKEDLVYSGPMYKEMKIEGNKAIISFDNMGKGLKVKDKYGYLKGFAIAGEDRKFHWAKAKITGLDTIEVSSPDVEKPISVRYGWANNPDDVNLYNSEDLPASPFRTDDWKGITK
jgi:sialate O-acetylesterase